jgi:hypothetical protein
LVYTESHDYATAASSRCSNGDFKEPWCYLKIKEYILAHSDLTSEADLEIVFESLPWARNAGRIWSRTRDYFTFFSDDLVWLSMTVDTPTQFWRAHLTPAIQACKYDDQTPCRSPGTGLLSIRVHLGGDACKKHRAHLESWNFLEYGSGYWSYNLWSE